MEPAARNFALLVMGQASSLVGNYTLKFALSMYVLEQTGSAAAFASMLAVSMVPTILLSPFGGVLADRADRRKVMVALDALSGGAVLAAWLVLRLGGGLPVVGGLLVVLSSLAAFESPTVQACIPQLLSGDSLVRGNAAVSQVQAVTALLTPFLGGVVYAAFGLEPVLWGTTVCFFLTALLECLLRLQPPVPGGGGTIRGELSDSLRFLYREQPEIFRLLLLAALVSLFMAGAMVVGFPYLVRAVLGLPAEYYGAAESAMGAAAVLGSLFVGATAGRLPLRRLAAALAGVGLCLGLTGLVFLAPLSLLGRYLCLLVLFCACQFGCSLFSTSAISVIQMRTPQQLMGKVMSYVFTLSLCAQPAGQMAYGLLFDQFARSPWWVLAPSGLLVCAVGAASRGFFRGLEAE